MQAAKKDILFSEMLYPGPKYSSKTFLLKKSMFIL